MPYVEGFGTYPFGEEWLFDAVIRSYLPVLEVARDLTLTVTPVLADQLEDAGAAQRLRQFLVDFRIGSAAADLADVVGGAAARLRGGARPLPSGRWSCSTRPAATRWRRSSGRRRRAGWRWPPPRPPTRCCRCWRRDAGLRLQLDAGIRSHRRRFGWDGGFWLPECAYDPGLEWGLARAGVEWFCVDQSRHEEPLAALRPVATEAGPVALPIDWEAISWLWALDGYPSDPAYAQFDGKSLRGIRLWRIGGGAYDPAAGGGGGAAPGGRVPRRGSPPACATTAPSGGGAA